VFKKTKHIGQNILLLFPAIGKLVKEIELARFGYTLGTLLEAGLPLIDALSSLSDVTGFRRYQLFFDSLRKEVENGNSFQKSFSSYPHTKALIPVPIQQMIVAAEKSGNLSQTLLNIGNMFEEKSEITIKNLSVALEPILLIIVWVGVLGIALAVILPLYSLLGGLN
jgi:type IV pilus assembly protein PilC